ncbi:MAG: BlaI/MecI/CopY family transcriptional regulator [Clostridia bacterium]|nr:BlaI/MecI/CopY family transcriptional regulator [Clostridia bacterium]
MSKVPRISDTEWQVMKILWTQSPISASVVIDRLEGVANWKPKTVKTLINRLVNKKAVDFEKDGRSYLYYPIVSEDECVKAESQSFLDRIYDGALNVMVAKFIEDRKLSKAEIEELKQILDSKSEEEGD